MNKRQFKEWATSLTTVGFFIIGLTGIMLYFHIFNTNVKLLHELLGLTFVGIVLGHVIANWNSMKSYFSKRTFFISSAVVLTLSGLFILNSLNQPANPKGIIINKLLKANIDDTLKVLNIEYTQAQVLLQKHRIVLTHTSSIETLSKEHGMSPFKVITLLNPNN